MSCNSQAQHTAEEYELHWQQHLETINSLIEGIKQGWANDTRLQVSCLPVLPRLESLSADQMKHLDSLLRAAIGKLTLFTLPQKVTARRTKLQSIEQSVAEIYEDINALCDKKEGLSKTRKNIGDSAEYKNGSRRAKNEYEDVRAQIIEIEDGVGARRHEIELLGTMPDDEFTTIQLFLDVVEELRAALTKIQEEAHRQRLNAAKVPYNRLSKKDRKSEKENKGTTEGVAGLHANIGKKWLIPTKTGAITTVLSTASILVALVAYELTKQRTSEHHEQGSSIVDAERGSTSDENGISKILRKIEEAQEAGMNVQITRFLLQHAGNKNIEVQPGELSVYFHNVEITLEWLSCNDGVGFTFLEDFQAIATSFYSNIQKHSKTFTLEQKNKADELMHRINFQDQLRNPQALRQEMVESLGQISWHAAQKMKVSVPNREKWQTYISNGNTQQLINDFEIVINHEESDSGICLLGQDNVLFALGQKNGVDLMYVYWKRPDDTLEVTIFDLTKPK